MFLFVKRIKPFQYSLTPFYFIATPIGNLSEFSPRALETLKSVTFVACEDSRVTGLLLNHFGISKPLLSVHKFNEKSKTDLILEKLNNGEVGAYLSDAGYPLISDPGYPLLLALQEANYPYTIINGPSALLHALTASGINSDHFYFHGFLSGNNKEKKETLQKLSNKEETLIIYEAPHRYLETIKLLYTYFGNRNLTIGRELTKMHEEYIFTTLEELSKEESLELKGELVLVVEGKKKQKSEHLPLQEVKKLIDNGYSLKEACKIVSLLYNVSKNELYQKLISE